MKRLIFFFALIGIFLSVDAGPRLDVDVGMDCLIELSETPIDMQNLAVATIDQNLGPIVFNEAGDIGAENPGEMRGFSLYVDQDVSKQLKKHFEGPVEDTQGVNIKATKTSTETRSYLEMRAMVYDKAYQSLNRYKNDLKRKGVEDRYSMG
jgi:hypothetical protein